MDRASRMSSRRLDDRLRELCAKVVRVSDEDAEPVIRELQSVLHEKIEQLRTLTAAHLTATEVLKAERRATPTRNGRKVQHPAG